jgi:signal transduction histidine kinase
MRYEIPRQAVQSRIFADTDLRRVVLARSGGNVILRVEDPGPGMRERRDAASATAQTGAGLGLDLCRLLLTRAGGGLRAADPGSEGRSAMEAWVPLGESKGA